jgi:hypothetical protein
MWGRGLTAAGLDWVSWSKASQLKPPVFIGRRGGIQIVAIAKRRFGSKKYESAWYRLLIIVVNHTGYRGRIVADRNFQIRFIHAQYFCGTNDVSRVRCANKVFAGGRPYARYSPRSFVSA